MTSIEEKNEENTKDKEDIAIEEREKMLNAENKAQDNAATDDKKIDIKEGLEAKPKKIPIGGIQMPGFFTRSKSKERCKDEGNKSDVEGGELIESKDVQQTVISNSRIKLPNPFRKSKGPTNEDANEAEKQNEQERKERRKLLDTIRLPLVSVFPRKKKSDQPLDSQAQAGLASVETLDENDRSADGKSTEMKTIPLDDKKDKDAEKQQEAASEEVNNWIQKLMPYRLRILAVLLFLLIVIIIIIFATSGKRYPTSPPVRDGKYIEAVTSCGKVEGMLEDSSFAFRGIPYARPPIGDLRFKYAQPLNSLDYCWNGTFIAHNATDVCLQILSNGTLVGQEDCLTLDVVTPYVRYENPLPVIVLIGADSLIGGSPGKMRPSARYARSRDVVFVRPNFRLGALGFLSLEMLSEADYPKSSGNYGLSDILEALRWVQLNIEHFGGDKRQVTLFGHRAGATLVTALATIPKANKYFARAWASSGGAIFPKKIRQESEVDNKSFLEAVNCKDIDCLRNMDARKLINSVEDTWRKPQPDLPNDQEDPDQRHEWLVLDGQILKEHPGEIWAKQENLPVDLVIGTTAHAASTDKLLMKYKNWTEPLVRKHIKESFLTKKNLTEEVLKMYPLTFKGLTSMISDIRTVCPLLAITSQMYKVPFYIVTQTRGEQDLADVDSDIEAILGRYEPKTPEQRRYFSAMQGLFYHYVWHGKIEQNMIGKKVLIVGQDVLPNATYSHCAFWINKNIVLPYAALD